MLDGSGEVVEHGVSMSEAIGHAMLVLQVDDQSVTEALRLIRARDGKAAWSLLEQWSKKFPPRNTLPTTTTAVLGQAGLNGIRRD